MRGMLLSVIAILLLTGLLYGQGLPLTGINPAITPEDNEQSEYFKTLTDGWIVGPILANRSFNFSLDNTTKGRKIQFRPNVSGNLGGRCSYKGYGLGLTFGVPGGAAEEKGDTDYLDLQFMFLLGRHGFDVIFQKYQGFYIDDEDLKSPQGEYRQYSDLVSQNISINYFYAFNPDYSLKAAFDQSARQLKDAGSWLIMGSMNQIFLYNSGEFIPPEYTADFSELTGLRAVIFSGLGASAGYAYTWVWKDYWYFTPALFLGLNMENQTYHISGNDYSQTVLWNPKINMKFAGGYNCDTWYAGAALLWDHTGALTTADIQINVISMNFQLFCGWRF